MSTARMRKVSTGRMSHVSSAKRGSLFAARRLTPRGSKPKKVHHKGWLEKRGPTHDFGWTKLWVVLTEEEIDFFEDAEEAPDRRVGEILLSEYVTTCEFKKKDAPGEACKYVKSHPFGFVVDSEPWGGSKRLAMFYLAAENAESMNQWIVQIHKATKHLKQLAPANRTSLAEFVALWDAPIVLCSSPDLGADKSGSPSMLSVPAICAAIVEESSLRARNSVVDGGAVKNALDAASGWFSTGAAEEEDSEQVAFPLHKYFSIAADFGHGHFCDTRVRYCSPSVDGKEAVVFTGKDDLDFDHAAAFKGPGAYNEEARFELACENSFAFTYWRGMVMGALTTAFVNMGNKPLPPVKTDKETRVGKMSQASAQGLRIGDAGMPAEQCANSTVRVVIVASIDGGRSEAVQKKHIPRLCKLAVSELKKTSYPWVDDAWAVWCHFPTPIDFVQSLAGTRNLVPDNRKEADTGEDEEQKPTTYTVHKYKRQPPAPSLLGNLSAEDIMTRGADAVIDMIESLLDACDQGCIKDVRSILDKKCSVSVKDDSGMSAIAVAAGQGHEEIVKELLSRRADSNTMDNEGDTVLTVAVGEGRLEVVDLLLKHDADPNTQVSGVWVDKPDAFVSLLDVATIKGYDAIVELFQPKAPEVKVAPKPALAPGPLAGPPRVQNLADELSELMG